jgi:hypothetical protein
MDEWRQKAADEAKINHKNIQENIGRLGPMQFSFHPNIQSIGWLLPNPFPIFSQPKYLFPCTFDAFQFRPIKII